MTAMQLQNSIGYPHTFRSKNNNKIKTKLSFFCFVPISQKIVETLLFITMQKRSESQHFKLPFSSKQKCSSNVMCGTQKLLVCISCSAKLSFFFDLANQSFKINERERFVLFFAIVHELYFLLFLLG